MSSYTKGASIIYRKVLHPILARREVSIDQWIGDQQERSMQVLLDAGRRGVQAAGNAALSGVTQFVPGSSAVTPTGAAPMQQAAAAGIFGSIVNGVQSLAAGAAETKRASPSDSGAVITEIEEEDVDETFEEIDESEIVSSGSDIEEEEDEDYEPPKTRRGRKTKAE